MLGAFLFWQNEPKNERTATFIVWVENPSFNMIKLTLSGVVITGNFTPDLIDDNISVDFFI